MTASGPLPLDICELFSKHILFLKLQSGKRLLGYHLRAVQNAACHLGGFIVSAAGTKQNPLHDFLSNVLCEINLLTQHFFQMF